MSSVNIHGIYRDRLIDESGRPVFDSGWKNNLIVLSCRVLLAGFLKNETALGIRSLKVGRGDPSWDLSPPPVPDPNTTTQLFDQSPFEIPLGANLTLQYLTTLDAVTNTPTNRLQITATLGPGQPAAATDPPFPLREFGLFGKLNGVDRMIDCIRHPLIQKDGAMTLERKVRLIF